MNGKIGRSWPGVDKTFNNIEKLIILQLLQTYYHPPKNINGIWTEKNEESDEEIKSNIKDSKKNLHDNQVVF